MVGQRRVRARASGCRARTCCARRNTHYWNDAATQLDGVKYLLIPDENAELARYRGGELQVTFVVPRGQFDWIKANLADQLHVAPAADHVLLRLQPQRAPFKDQPAAAPRAVAGHRPREARRSWCCASGELPAYGWVPPGIDNYTAQSFDYRNAAHGRAHPRGAAPVRRRPATRVSKPLRFELRYNTGEVHTKLAVAIASMWKEALGVDVHLTQVEFKSLLQDIDRGDVEMFRSSWVGDYNDAYTFAQYLKSDFGVNLPHYHSPQLRRAAGAGGGRRPMPGKRRALLEQAEGLMLARSPAAADLLLREQAPGETAKSQGWYDNVMNVVYSKDLRLQPPAP